MRIFLSVVWVAMALLGASQSEAATMQTIYTGTVSSYSDPGGIFGPAGADQTGTGFTVTTVYDTSLGNFASLPIGTSLSGDTTTGSVFRSILVSIGGVNLSLQGNAFSNVSATSPGFGTPTTTFSQIGIDTTLNAGTRVDTSLQMQVAVPGAGAFPTDLLQPFTLTGLPGGLQSFGVLSITTTAAGSQTPTLAARIGFSVSGLAVSAVIPAQVPLPATAGLLAAALAGFGGLASRRKRASAR